MDIPFQGKGGSPCLKGFKIAGSTVLHRLLSHSGPEEGRQCLSQHRYRWKRVSPDALRLTQLSKGDIPVHNITRGHLQTCKSTAIDFFLSVAYNLRAENYL